MAALDLLHQMSLELTDVDIGTHVDRVDINSITPLQFATQYVAKNKPVILTGAIHHWPALKKWSSDYLSHIASGLQVTVDLTPNGRGDSVTRVARKQCSEHHSDRRTVQEHHEDDSCSWFITPCEVQMGVKEFFTLFRQSRDLKGTTRVVPYVQHQNSSLTEEWDFLAQDIQPGLTWADEVFGGPPEATNIWIGDERSVTSFHKDHYENLYAVVRGTKIFHLLPPGDMYRMNLRKYPAAHYVMQHVNDNKPQASQIDSSIPNDQQQHRILGYKVAVDGRHSSDAANSGISTSHYQDESNGGTHLMETLSPSTCFTVYTKDSNRDSTASYTECKEERSGQVANTLVLGATQLVPVINDPPQQVVWSNQEVVLCQQPTIGNAREIPSNLLQDPSLPTPLVAEVGPGEVLYLPAMWYHQVSQRCSEADKGHDYVIAVNYWYDMAFDSRWSYFKLVEGLATQLGLADSMEA